MAFPTNTTTGKAVADIKALYFYKHGTDGEPTISEVLDSTEWFPVITLRGSVNVSQDAVSLEKINIDQSNMPIGITTEPGDFTFEAMLPSMVMADLTKWLESHDEASEAITFGGKKGIGYNVDGAVIECSVLVQTRTNDTFIFSRAAVSVALAKDDKTFGLQLSGQVLGASNEDNRDIYVIADNAA